MPRKAVLKIVLNKEQANLWAKLTQLQKRFVTELTSGKGKSEAYICAGCKATSDSFIRSGASRMSTNVNVKAFLESINIDIRQFEEEQLSDAILTKQEAEMICTDIARTSMTDLVTYGTYQIGEDQDGNPINQSVFEFKKSALNDPKKMASITELTAGPQGLKIKIEKRTKGIDSMRAMKGWDKATESNINLNAPRKTWSEMCEEARGRVTSIQDDDG